MPSDFDKDGGFISANKPMVDRDAGIDKHLLEPGDILMATKSSSFSALSYEVEWGPSIASSSFVVLRQHKGLSSSVIERDYLVWYLNNERTRKTLRNMTVGTAVQSIPASTLAKLEIEIPPIETQRQILRLDQLHSRKISLRNELNRLEDDLFTAHTFKIIQNASH